MQTDMTDVEQETERGMEERRKRRNTKESNMDMTRERGIEGRRERMNDRMKGERRRERIRKRQRLEDEG
eukprot:5409149-Pyramimonas_sp.AAC.1